MVTSVSCTFIFAMQILILWLLNPLQIYKHSPTKLVWLVRKLLLPESFTIQNIATTKDRVPFIVLSPYAVLPVRAYKRGARLQRTGRCLLYRDFFRKTKTSDFFGQKYGGFASKVRRFASKKSDVLHFPYTTTKSLPLPLWKLSRHSSKKVFWKKTTFPTPFHKSSFMYRLFRV